MTTSESRHGAVSGEEGGVRPAVTVVVPTRGRPDLARRAVDSILRQDYLGQIDCVVVFDQEEPRDLGLNPPPGRQIRLLANERTPGLAGARNTGILAARGTYVAHCDDDDEWLPQKLSLQVDLLERHDQAVVAGSGILGVYSNNRTKALRPPTEVRLENLLRSRVRALHSSTLIARREAIVQRVGLVDEQMPGGWVEDYEWLLRAAACGPIVCVTEPLCLIHWDQPSWFRDRWGDKARDIDYLLQRHPELRRDRRRLSTLLGQKAFALAAAGHRGRAVRSALDSLVLNPGQPRPYLALGVAIGLLRPARILRVLARRI